ncbi:hypothetical protein BKA65DRAFT_111615 [Rhexocercosporidium sp. MPI-PUGE-AT-0058]|nr:hypothetical protein BKA65DRAFT_111615 [Rhexocercosporidium sp. MPI-PUGE-AT-0058]
MGSRPFCRSNMGRAWLLVRLRFMLELFARALLVGEPLILSVIHRPLNMNLSRAKDSGRVPYCERANSRHTQIMRARKIHIHGMQTKEQPRSWLAMILVTEGNIVPYLTALILTFLVFLAHHVLFFSAYIWRLCSLGWYSVFLTPFPIK